MREECMTCAWYDYVNKYVKGVLVRKKCCTCPTMAGRLIHPKEPCPYHRRGYDGDIAVPDLEE